MYNILVTKKIVSKMSGEGRKDDSVKNATRCKAAYTALQNSFYAPIPFKT